MLRGTNTLAKNFRLSLKYPSLVSYNKLPWEVINHETPALHMHLAPQYEQVLTLAATTNVPHLAQQAHPKVAEAQRLQVLPGMLYVSAGEALPSGFTAHDVTDPTVLQYYGTLSHTIAPVRRVRMLTSDDLRLLCIAVTFEDTLLSSVRAASLAQVGTGGKSPFTLYHYFRPNRPVSELTRPLERYFQHRPRLAMLSAYMGGEQWTPRLNAPKRTGSKKTAMPMAPYNPPQSYLMGLAERLAVIPGSSFGRRGLMWGTWF